MYGSGIWLIQPIAPAFLLKDLLPVSPWLFVHHYSHPLGCPLKPILLFIMLCSPQGSWGTLPFWAEAVFLAPPDCEATQGSATKSLFCHGCWLCHGCWAQGPPPTRLNTFCQVTHTQRCRAFKWCFQNSPSPGIRPQFLEIGVGGVCGMSRSKDNG